MFKNIELTIMSFSHLHPVYTAIIALIISIVLIRLAFYLFIYSISMVIGLIVLGIQTIIKAVDRLLLAIAKSSYKILCLSFNSVFKKKNIKVFDEPMEANNFDDSCDTDIINEGNNSKKIGDKVVILNINLADNGQDR